MLCLDDDENEDHQDGDEEENHVSEEENDCTDPEEDGIAANIINYSYLNSLQNFKNHYALIGTQSLRV